MNEATLEYVNSVSQLEEPKWQVIHKADEGLDILLKDAANYPGLVKEALTYAIKVDSNLKRTSIDGFYVSEGKNLFSKEYYKSSDGDNWILYIYIDSNKVHNFENTLEAFEEYRVAVAKIDGVYYVTIAGSKEVFKAKNKYVFSGGVIDFRELDRYMDSLPARDMYKLEEMNAYLIDSPAPIFMKQTAFNRNGDLAGYWISFGTFLKVYLDNFNSINVDGVEVSLIDINLDEKSKIRKMLENTSANYASLLIDLELYMKEVLKEAKQWTWDANKVKDTSLCADNLINNLAETGILGITYNEVTFYDKGIIPAFNKYTSSVDMYHGKVVEFVYEDEIIIIGFNEDKIFVQAYKGKKINVESTTGEYRIELYPDLNVTKTIEVVDDAVALTGFDNLKYNSDLDFYMTDKATIVNSSSNSKIAFDITSFSDFFENGGIYSDFLTDDVLMKVFGNSLIPLKSALIYYKLSKQYSNCADFQMSSQAAATIGNSIDVANKKVYIDTDILIGYQDLMLNYFSPKKEDLKVYILKEAGYSDNEIKYLAHVNDKYLENYMPYFLYWSVIGITRMPYFINREIENDKLTMMQGETLKFYENTVSNFKKQIDMQIGQIRKMLNSMEDMEQKQKFLDSMTTNLYEFIKQSSEAQLYSLDLTLKFLNNRQPFMALTDERYEFEKAVDKIYINNKPVSEITNHILLNRDTISKMIINNYYSVHKPFINGMEDGDLSVIGNLLMKDIKDNNKYTFLGDSNINIITVPDLGLEIKTGNYKNIIDTYQIKKTYVDVKLNNLGITYIKGDKYKLYQIVPTLKGVISGSLSELTLNFKKNIVKEMGKYGIQVSDNNLLSEEFVKEMAKNTKEININNEIPLGTIDPVKIAYGNGRILVSIDGLNWYEPFEFEKGLKLNKDISIIDYRIFEKRLQLISLVNQRTFEYKYETDLEETTTAVALEYKTMEKLGENAVKFTFKVLKPLVYNGTLYKVSDELEIEFDEIDWGYGNKVNNAVYLKLADIYFEYDSYLVYQKESPQSEQELLESPNAFRFIHRIPLVKKLNADFYYDSVDDMVEDGCILYVDFTKKEN